MRRLVIQPQAEVDIVEAVAWYEVQRTGLGFELIDELDSIIGRVVRHPLQFPQVKPEVRRALLSKFPYSVYFRVTDPTAEIIAVLHQRRDPRTWQQRAVTE